MATILISGCLSFGGLVSKCTPEEKWELESYSTEEILENRQRMDKIWSISVIVFIASIVIYHKGQKEEPMSKEEYIKYCEDKEKRMKEYDDYCDNMRNKQ